MNVFCDISECGNGPRFIEMGDLLGTSSAAFESNFGSLRTDKDAMADGLRKVALASGDQSMRAFGKCISLRGKSPSQAACRS